MLKRLLTRLTGQVPETPPVDTQPETDKSFGAPQASATPYVVAAFSTPATPTVPHETKPYDGFLENSFSFPASTRPVASPCLTPRLVGATTSGALSTLFQSNHSRVRLKLLSNLGKGAQGKVYHAQFVSFEHLQRKIRTADCAVKELKNRHPQPLPELHLNSLTEVEALLHRSTQESEKIGVLQHIGVVSVPKDNTRYIVMSKCPNTLDKVMPLIGRLKAIHPSAFQQVQLHFVKSWLAGLAFLEQNNLVHCDIKPNNTGITSSGHCVFMDFDMARLEADLRRALSENETVGGTFLYQNPESRAKNYGKNKENLFALDRFSVGQMIRQLLGEELLYTPEIYKEQEQQFYETSVMNDMCLGYNLMEYEDKLKQFTTQKVDATTYQRDLNHRLEKTQSFEQALSLLSEALCHPDSHFTASLETQQRFYEKLAQLCTYDANNLDHSSAFEDIMMNVLSPPGLCINPARQSVYDSLLGDQEPTNHTPGAAMAP